MPSRQSSSLDPAALGLALDGEPEVAVLAREEAGFAPLRGDPAFRALVS